MRRHTHCALNRERIHGFLDGALPQAEMEQVAAHVAACEQCREEVAQFRTLKAALLEMRTPNGSGDARDRVFARYREAAPVRTEATPVRPAAMRGRAWTRHPALSLALAAAAAALIAFLPPVATPDTSPPVLPGPAEMSVLSERHDLHIAHVEEGVRPAGDRAGTPSGASRDE